MTALQNTKGNGPLVEKPMRDVSAERAGGGGRWSWWLARLTLVIGVSAMVLSGCLPSDGSSGSRGATGETGDPGPPGTDGSPGTVGEVRPSVTVTDAFISDNAGQPVVEFEVTAQLPPGASPFEPPPGNLEFTVARLVDKDGYQTWQSYLTTEVDPTAPRTGNFARLQADQVRGDHPEGVLESLGGNQYRYTYPVNVNDVPAEYQNGVEPVSADDWVDASEIDLRRFVVLLRPGSNWDAAYDYMDVGMGESKDSVASASCNNCHDNLAAHGNNRIGVQTCSNCHNQFTFSSFTDDPNAVDLAYVGHEIHSGGGILRVEDDEDEQPVRLLRDRWTGVAFPSDIKTCSACHDASEAVRAEHAFEKPSVQACSSCHNNDQYTGADPTFPPAGHWKDTDRACVNCHAPGTEVPADVVHVDPARQFARDGDLRYVIDSATLMGDTLTVEWRALYDDTAIVHGDNGWTFGPSFSLRVGWFDTDFTHSDPDSSRPGHPVEIGNPHDGNHAGGGLYVTTVDLSGKGQDGDLYVSLGGRIDSADHEELVASNAIWVEGEGRRQVVTNATCTTCHEDRHGVFNKHGNNQHNNVQQCILCHNNNSTDWARRTADGRAEPPVGSLDVEAPTNFMVMIHKLHSADGNYALPGFPAGSWSDWGDLRYPTSTANCTQCHEGDTYYPVARTLEPRGTTVDSREGSTDVDTHWKTSAAMAACSSCHDSRDAEEHMKQNGSVGGDHPEEQPTIDGSTWETCSTCHGPGRTADVRTVHGLPD